MRAFKSREFSRVARKLRVPDLALYEAIDRAERGLIDARIGRFLIKQRIARAKQGRSGGFRAIIFHRYGDRVVFLHLFAKNEKDNLSDNEEAAYRNFAKELAALDDGAIDRLVNDKRWMEIDYEEYRQQIPERAVTLPASGSTGLARGRRNR